MARPTYVTSVKNKVTGLGASRKPSINNNLKSRYLQQMQGREDVGGRQGKLCLYPLPPPPLLLLPEVRLEAKDGGRTFSRRRAAILNCSSDECQLLTAAAHGRRL
jgi:hypothetical protein